MIKLTKPQEDLLAEIAERTRAISDTYKPAQKLVELGYARGFRGKRLGGFFIEITDAGRLALQELRFNDR